MHGRRLIGTTLASVAVALPAAQAQAQPVEGVDISPAQTPALATPAGTQAAANQANERQHYGGEGVRQAPTPTPTATPATTSNGFDWGDYGLGGATAAAIALALLGTRRLVEAVRHTPGKQLRTS